MGAHKQRYPATAGTTVRVETAHGNLVVFGWDSDEIEADGAMPAASPSAGGDLTFSSDGTCRLRVPRGVHVVAERVHGHLVIQDLLGSVSAAQVGANVSARGVQSLELETVGGDVHCRSVAGDFRAEQVGGSVRADGVGGDLALEAVGGHLMAVKVRGAVSASVGGHAVLRLDEPSRATVTVNAGGNIRAELGETVPGRVSASSGAGSVRLDGPDGQDTRTASTVERDMGTDGRPLELNAGGRVTVRYGGAAGDQSGEAFLGEGLAAMAEEYAAQVEARVEGYAEHFSTHLADVVGRLPWLLDRAGLAADEAERIVQRVATAGERAMHRAEHQAARALRHAERRQARGEAFRRRATSDESPRPSASTEHTETERDAVLRMLASGRLNADQANELLAALESAR